MMANIHINSVVTGIHTTKVGSHREIGLHVENDDSIPNCMTVTLEEIPRSLHKEVTYP